MTQYSMYREDRKGEHGPMSDALWADEDGAVQVEHDARPRVGVQMRVSSSDRWWQTTFVTGIILDEPKKVVFKTKNSTYTWEIW